VRRAVETPDEAKTMRARQSEYDRNRRVALTNEQRKA